MASDGGVKVSQIAPHSSPTPARHCAGTAS
jgi:hypothetical protein